ncbi:MAG: glycine C-acetyltransferase [Patescibacteria group bacterium]
MNPKDFYKQIEEIVKSGKFPLTIESGQGPYLTINGDKKLNFCSNNYLGFASNKDIKKAAIDAINTYGVGTASVRSLSGTNTLHLELEGKLAQFKKAEAAIVLTGGYMANLCAIQTILDKDDVVVSDELNHASIIDAVRLSQVQNKFVYEHKDMQDLRLKLKEATLIKKIKKENGEYKKGLDPKILIITDGVFSMDGDLAPLPEIVLCAKEYGALVMVDDAHGEGVIGGHGRGIVDHFKLHSQVDIEVGTLSKAFGVIGGFITGRKVLIDFYRQKSRQFLFSNGLSIPDTAALIKAVEILESSDDLVKRLWENGDYLKKEFIKLGFDIGHSETPITPIMLNDEDIAKTFSNKLLDYGVFATPILFPMVAKGKARIRVMPSAIHTKDDLDFGIEQFLKVAKGLKII